jgi:hypothetical protein
MRKTILTFTAMLLGCDLAFTQSLFITERSEGPSIPLFDLPRDVESFAQEFTARSSKIDFVSFGRWPHGTSRYRVVIREDSIHGPIIGASSNLVTIAEAADRDVFAFAPPVTLMLGAQYVIEVTELQPFLLVVFGGAHEGRLFVNGEVWDDDYDLDFSIGVFIPQIVTSDALNVYIREEESGTVAPEAVFTNDYVADYRGSVLTLSYQDEWGQGSTLDDRIGVVRFRNYDTITDPLLEYEGRVVGTITETVIPRSISITFNSAANAAAVQYAIRNLLVANFSDDPPGSRLLSLTFTHSSGAIHLPFRYNIIPFNDPPNSIWHIEGLGRQLFSQSIVIAGARKPASVIMDGSESFDVDSKFLEFTWNELIQESQSLQPLANRGLRVTNNFPLGVHWVGFNVSDGESESQTGYMLFEVITVRTAITRLLDSFEGLDIPEEWQRRFRAPLRQANRALAQQHRGSARNFLRSYQRRVATFGESQPFYASILAESAQTVLDALSR